MFTGPWKPTSPGDGTLALDLAAAKHRRTTATVLLALLGPGLMVMLADTDAGSVLTAAQSGARFRYALVLPEICLIPVLYLVQEMTARLGLVTGQGHGALIRRSFGARWAAVSAGTLFAACVGALVTEFAGISGVGLLLGIPRWASTLATLAALATLVLLGRYRRVEHVGIAIGVLELLFIPAALLAHPHVGTIVHDLAHPIVGNRPYFMLLAANVGAVIMPWMVFYQQEAVIDKGRHGLELRTALRSARADTAVGSLVTQLVMIAVIVATGATLATRKAGTSLHAVGQIATALAPFVGRHNALVLFGAGLIGAAVVAALVVMLAGAWGISEVLGWRHSLNDSPRRAAGFYSLAVAGLFIGATLVLVAPNLVNLSVDVEVMNACLLPIVLGFLLVLERRALPPEHRMRGGRRAVTYAVTSLVIGLGLVTAVMTFVH